LPGAKSKGAGKTPFCLNLSLKDQVSLKKKPLVFTKVSKETNFLLLPAAKSKGPVKKPRVKTDALVFLLKKT
jgi:hypothetical protein